MTATKLQCPECKRVFDLMDEGQAGEWYYGHDCDPDYVPEVLSQPITVTADAQQVTLEDGTTKWGYNVLVNGETMMLGAVRYESESEALAESVSMQNCYREIHGLPPLN